MIVILVVAIACAWASHAVAEAKGRSAGGYALLGFLLGPLGLLIAACMPNLKRAAYDAAILAELRQLRGERPPPPLIPVDHTNWREHLAENTRREKALREWYGANWRALQ